MAAIPYTQAQMQQLILESLECRRQWGGINQMMELSLESCYAETGVVHLSHPMAFWETNVIGTMHGGLITLLLDSAMAIAALCCTGNRRMPTSDIHVSFLRPVQQDSTVHIRAYSMHAGKRLLQMRAELWTNSPELPCACASATFYRVGETPDSKG